jgi:hypothetical protein
MRQAAMRQQIAQMQMARAQQLVAERQAGLAKRQANAEKTRLATAERREQARQRLAAQNGLQRPTPASAPAPAQLARR